MKLFVHVTIWNKAAHVPWICEGIKNSIPTDSVIDFALDNCTDSTEKNLMYCLKHSNYGGLGRYKVNITQGRKYRWPNANDAIKRFLETDCTHFFSPQDDQQIQDKYIVRNLETLYEMYNPGLVGMRDGIDIEGDFFSSQFSKPGKNVHWLISGESEEVVYVNDGPICISREVIETIGVFDEGYIAHYADNDYSFRCNEAGLKNYVMGAEIVHEKWGCKVCGEIQPSEVWGQEISAKDNQYYRSKWPRNQYP